MRRVISVFVALLLSLLAIGAGCARAPAPAPTVTVPAPTVTAPGPTVTVTAPAPTPTPTTVSAAEFFKNNTVTINVAYSAGGGQDYTARLLASFWPDVTGGRMVVFNRATGGGLTNSNYIYTAKPDGLTIGLTAGASALYGAALFKDPGVQFDTLKFTWIGAYYKEPQVLAMAAGLPYQSLAEVQQATGLKLGLISRRGIIAVASALAIELLGLKDARIIPGYGGTTELSLAAGRKEIDGLVYSSTTTKREVGKGYFKPALLVVDNESDVAFPQAPPIAKVVQVSPDNQRILDIVSYLRTVYHFFAPPDMPPDRLEFLRGSFEKIFADAGFVTQMKRVWPEWTGFVKGADLAKEIGLIMKISPEDLAKSEALIDKYVR
ncbi:MAG: hypothetical protein HY530_02310 [Chloroflexi bacterium]|nr:hypothetical protein [Chloroflexota bacterium]